MMRLIGTAFIAGVTVTLAVAYAVMLGFQAHEWLWVAWIPAGVCGVVTVAAVLYRSHLGESNSDIRRSLSALWDAIGL